METTFYLNNQTIYFLFTHKGKKIRKTTTKKINPKYWGSGFPLQKKETLKLRQELSNYKIKIDSYISDIISKKGRQPTNLELSDFLKILLGEQRRSTSISDLIDIYIDYSERYHAKKTIQIKKIHLNDFREFVKSVEVNDLQKKIFTNYINRLVDRDLEVETINSYIKNLKAMFNYFYKEEILDINFGDKRYLTKYSSKSKPIITLTEDELLVIESYELSNIRLQRVVDLFLIGCYTGLRFEDLTNFNIVDKEGSKQIQISKTGQIINIPIIAESLRIFKKYNYILPKISNQKGNDYLKEAFKEYGLFRLVTENRNYVNRVESVRLPLYEAITFHKSRKTFITVALQRGISKRIVMALAGIESESVFKKYADYADKEGEEAMNNIFSQGARQPLTADQYEAKQNNAVFLKNAAKEGINRSIQDEVRFEKFFTRLNDFRSKKGLPEIKYPKELLNKQ